MNGRSTLYSHAYYAAPTPSGRKNQLLGKLSSQTYAMLAPHLSARNLSRGQILHVAGQPVERVYFPHDGLVSLLSGGSAAEVETALIGRNGCIGLAGGLVSGIALSRAMVIVPGEAAEIATVRLRELAEQDATLRHELARWNEQLTAQITQTVVCATRHGLEERLCRWLLQAYDSAGSILPVKQQMLADFLGVRRTSVTLFMRMLSQENAICTHRGIIEILDPAVLERKACACRREGHAQSAAQREPTAIPRPGLAAYETGEAALRR
jgi:CRP-like cAMP-binding protein